MRKSAVALITAGVVSFLSADGATLYKNICAPCHGDKGEKKALGLSAHIGEMRADTIFEALKIYKRGLLAKYGPRSGLIMKNIASSLSEAQMKSIADYIGRKYSNKNQS